jgi:hypothetical protein
MIDRAQRSEPYEIALPYGLSVTVKPLTTAGMAPPAAAILRCSRSCCRLPRRVWSRRCVAIEFGMTGLDQEHNVPWLPACRHGCGGTGWVVLLKGQIAIRSLTKSALLNQARSDRGDPTPRPRGVHQRSCVRSSSQGRGRDRAGRLARMPKRFPVSARQEIDGGIRPRRRSAGARR